MLFVKVNRYVFEAINSAGMYAYRVKGVYAVILQWLNLSSWAFYLQEYGHPFADAHQVWDAVPIGLDEFDDKPTALCHGLCDVSLDVFF